MHKSVSTFTYLLTDLQCTSSYKATAEQSGA